MIVDLIEALYRLLWGDLFTLPVAGGMMRYLALCMD